MHCNIIYQPKAFAPLVLDIGTGVEAGVEVGVDTSIATD